MLGLNVDVENRSKSSWNRNTVARSSRFAEGLRDRFNVVGVSGGFEKHTKARQEFVRKTREDKARNVILSKMKDDLKERRQAEYDADASRLAAIEAQLEEIRRMKILKAQREEKRRMRKVQHDASCLIQEQVKIFLIKRKQNATHMLLDFLLALHKGQTIRVLAWAVRKLRKFLILIKWKWQRYKTKLIISNKLSHSLWSNVSKNVTRTIQIKSLTPQLVKIHIAHGYHMASVKIIKARPPKKPKNAKYSRSTFRTPGSISPSGSGSNHSTRSRIKSVSHIISSSVKYSTESMENNHDSENNNDLNKSLESLPSMSSLGDSMGSLGVLLGDLNLPPLEPEPIPETWDEMQARLRAEEIEERHRLLREQAEKERQKRLQIIEQRKQEKLAEELRLKKLEDEKKKAKELNKEKFFKKIILSQSEGARKAALKREEREAQLAALEATKELERQEAWIMKREDFLSRAMRAEEKALDQKKKKGKDEENLESAKVVKELPKWNQGAGISSRRPITPKPAKVLTVEEMQAVLLKQEADAKEMARRVAKRLEEERKAAEDTEKLRQERETEKQRVLDEAKKKLLNSKKSSLTPGVLKESNDVVKQVWGGGASSNVLEARRRKAVLEKASSEASIATRKKRKKPYNRMQKLMSTPPTILRNLSSRQLRAYGLKLDKIDNSPGDEYDNDDNITIDDDDDDYTTSVTSAKASVSMKKSQSQSAISKKKNKKGGKVATLMEMVSRARERLSGSLSESQLPINPTTAMYEEEEKENIKNEKTFSKSKNRKVKKNLKNNKSSPLTEMTDLLDNFSRSRPNLPPKLDGMNSNKQKTNHRYGSVNNLNDNANNDIEIDGDEQEDEASGELLFDVFSAEAGFPFEKVNPNMFGLEGVSRPSSTTLTPVARAINRNSTENQPIKNEMDIEYIEHEGEEHQEKVYGSTVINIPRKGNISNNDSKDYNIHVDYDMNEVMISERDNITTDTDPHAQVLNDSESLQKQLDDECEQLLAKLNAAIPSNISAPVPLLASIMPAVEPEIETDDLDRELPGRNAIDNYVDINNDHNVVEKNYENEFDEDDDDDDDGDEHDEELERQLNLECEMLRARISRVIDGLEEEEEE